MRHGKTLAKAEHNNDRSALRCHFIVGLELVA